MNRTAFWQKDWLVDLLVAISGRPRAATEPGTLGLGQEKKG